MFPQDRHSDYGLMAIWEELGRPGLFYLDFRPLGNQLHVCANPELAEVVTRPSAQFKYSFPKSRLVNEDLSPILGHRSILMKSGNEWRDLRRMYSPAFQPKQINRLIPDVLKHTTTMVCRVSEAADAKATLCMSDLAKDFSADVVAQIVLGQDLQVQKSREGDGEKCRFGLITTMRTLAELYPKSVISKFEFVRRAKTFVYAWLFDYRAARFLRSFTNDANSSGSTSSSVFSLATIPKPISRSTFQSMPHQLRNFLLGGEDTTSAMLQWIVYELAKNPHVLTSMLSEHQSILGSNALSSLSGLDAATLLQKLPYTTAILKEVLRLHPPAATSRHVPRGSNCKVMVRDPMTEKEVEMELDGTDFYVNHFIIGRNPLVWGPSVMTFDPSRFVPDPSQAPPFPRTAFRFFERGPRTCLGKDLAMLEGKVFLIALGDAYRKKGLRWEKVGNRGWEIDGMEEVFDILKLTHQPVDGMRVRWWWEESAMPEKEVERNAKMD